MTPQLDTSRIRPRTWLILVVAFLIVESALLVNHAALDSYSWLVTRWVVGDRDSYSWRVYSADQATTDAPIPDFYAHTAPPFNSRLYARTERLWQVLKDFGEGWMTAILIIALAIYHRRTIIAAGIAILATSLAGGMGALIRILAGRWRPIHIEARNTWEFLRGFHDGTDLSFPSGHATLAFATAAVFIYFSPRGKCLFLTVAAGTALSRVVMGAHFYSDVLFGAMLGWTIGWFTCVLCDKCLSKLEAAKSPPSP